MPVVSLSVADGIAEILMCNGENRHNPTFLQEIQQALNDAEADPRAQALILSSADAKCWSLGMDLDWLMPAIIDEARRPELRAFLFGMNDLYRRLLSFPLPVIAALGGHAFGNGAILSCACDFRFMLATRGYFCLPEVDVNIPLLPGMFAVLKKAVPPHLLNELALSGRRVGGQEALEQHLAQGVFAGAPELRAGVYAFAQGFKKNRTTLRAQKTRNYKWIFEVLDHEDPPLIETLNLVM